MDFEIPENQRYLETHEWVRVEDDVGTVGITDFAQDELGDIIFLELPDVGETFDRTEQFGAVESIKALSELYAPMSGTVVAVNDRLYDEPELVNEDPNGEGWMLRIEVEDESEYDELRSAAEYRDANL
jgi:glycine cleavage system H protein